MGNERVAHSAHMKVMQTTLCNIANRPAEFIGKTVEIRAQIWPD